jgi:hypothetical protein
MSLRFNPITGLLDVVNKKTHEEGTFACTNQPVPAGATYTLAIPLSRSDFKMGHLLLYVPQGASSSWRRAHSYIMFTTDINNAKAQSTGRSYNMISLCVFYDWWVKAYAYEDDGFLSGKFYNNTGWQLVRIKSVQIVGNTIELVLENAHATQDATVTIRGNFHVYK